MATKFELRMLSPSRPVATHQATSVVLPGVLGYMTILPDHASMIAELGIGEVTVESSGGADRYFVSGGYIEVERNRVKVLADVVEKASDIDLARARDAQQRALTRLGSLNASTDIERANRSIKRAEVRIMIAETMASVSHTH